MDREDMELAQLFAARKKIQPVDDQSHPVDEVGVDAYEMECRSIVSQIWLSLIRFAVFVTSAVFNYLGYELNPVWLALIALEVYTFIRIFRR